MTQTKTTPEKTSVALALYPHPKGMAYAIMDTQRDTVIHSGQHFFFRTNNAKCIKGAKKLMSYYRPSLVVLEDTNSKVSFKGERTKKLITYITNEAIEMRLPVHSYTREQIREAFETFGSVTRHQIATQIAKWYPEYQSKVPPAPSILRSESAVMGEFDALSLACTFLYFR